MKLDQCPNCRSRSGLTHYCTLLLSFEMWPAALIYALVVLAFAQKLTFDTSHTVFFISLAILPMLFRVINKQACDNCGAEFRDSSDQHASAHPTDLL